MHTILRFAPRIATVAVLSAVCVISLSSISALPAEAATLPTWQWSDASASMSVRSDRPVWALAYTNAGFIGTDGQWLSRSGRVWKTDGTKTTDLTVAAKNAGLSHVDAIVSDGANAMLLQNPGRSDLVIVSYNGNFQDRTGEIKAILETDEAVAAISGKSGSWLIVTTKGNVLEWTPATYSFVKRPTFAYGVSQHIAKVSLRYRLPQDFSDYASTAVLPLSNGWLIILPMNDSIPRSEYYFYSNGTANDVTKLFPNMGTISASASNGDRALLIGANYGWSRPVVGYTYDGVSMTTINNMSASGLNRSGWLGANMAWTGSAWNIFAGKNGFRIQDASLSKTSTSRDYFMTVASNNKGTVLLGGAVSTVSKTLPTTPLTAKLVRLNETASITYANTSSSLKTSAWAWVEPTTRELAKDQQTTYNVGAWSPSGIKTIELFANGLLVRYCDLGTAQGNQHCSVAVKGETYAQTGLVTLQGRVTDGAGNRIAVAETALTIKNNIVQSTQTSASNIAAWGWFETQPYVARNGVVSFRSQAQASNGLSRIEIFVNGYKRKTCSFTSNPTEIQDCDTIIFGNEYIDGTYGVTVKAFDVNGTEKNSQNYNLTFTAYDKSGNEMPAVAAVALSPNKAKYMPDDSTTYTISAADMDGITKIEILVDWEVGNVCQTNTYDAATCAISFEGYKNAGKDHVIISRVTDKRGNVVWTGMKNISFAASRDTYAKATVWATPNKTDIRTNESAFIGATAYANNDARQIDLYVNGISKYTCTYTNGAAEKNCSIKINGSDYTGSSAITVQAKITNSNGISFWTSTRNIRMLIDTSGLWYGDLPNLQIWSSRGGNGNVTLTANGQSPAGVQRIDMLVNGSSVASCENKTTCSWSGYVNTGSTFSAMMTDKNGRLTWSGYNQLLAN